MVDCKKINKGKMEYVPRVKSEHGPICKSCYRAYNDYSD
jgi:hypothetical protein